MNDFGLVLIIFISVFLLLLPRRLALIPLVIGTCYITLGQGIEVLGINFYALRIFIFIGWVRIILRREITFIKLNTIDKVILLWITSSVVTYTLLYQTTGAVIYRLGLAYNSLGLYFFFRALIRDLEDFNRVLRMFAWIIIPLAALMFYEHWTGKNVFATFGGVHEVAEFRKGHFRSQGPFRHPILAGTFGATLVPLMVSLWWQERGKLVAFLGVMASSIIVLSTASSGPLMAYLFGVLGLLAWRYRGYMKTIRWMIACMLLTLHFVIMKAPVWYLFDRVSSLTGGSGWYRAELIEQAVVHFNEWWLIGTKNTAKWMPFSLTPDKADITNQFIGEGVNGGLLTLIFFVLIIVYCFKTIGHAIRGYDDSPFNIKISVWSMGAALFAHVMSFCSVGYFDQIIVVWFLLLAMISTVDSSLNNSETIQNTGLQLQPLEYQIRKL
jgi:hypothetical protein